MSDGREQCIENVNIVVIVYRCGTNLESYEFLNVTHRAGHQILLRAKSSKLAL